MKKLIIVGLIINIIFLTGCWDIREINQIGFVMAVAVDKADDSNNFIVSVQIANPKPVAASKEKQAGASEPVWVFSAQGKTIFEAVREISQISSKRIMWAHNSIVIIGESLARYDVSPVIDFFTHNPELRMKTSIVVSKGKAKDYIGTKQPMEDIGGVSLATMFDYAKLTGESIKGDMLRFSQDFFSNRKQPLLSMIGFKREKIVPSEGKSNEEADAIELAGAAVFKRSKMVGILSPEETRGVAWVFNSAENTLVTVTGPGDDGKNLSVETKNVKSKVISQIIDGMPSIEIKISGSGEMVEEDGATDMPMEEFKKKVKELVDNKIVEDIVLSINKVQKEYKTDSMDFANTIHAKHSKEWKSGIADNWDSIYPDVPVSISADIEITGSTLNQTPAQEAK